jgi:hypothetical protein
MRHEIGVFGIACAKIVSWEAGMNKAGSLNSNLPFCMTRILKSCLIWVDFLPMMLEPLGAISGPHLLAWPLISRLCTHACAPCCFTSRSLSFHSSPHAYATIVLAVALSYLHVGGNTPTVL